MCMYQDTSEKWGLSYTNPEKWGQSFAEKKGLIIYSATLKKGAILHAQPYYAIYRKLPLPYLPRVKKTSLNYPLLPPDLVQW